MLKIYNTLTRSKEVFTPRVAGKVGMYVCGMTVYDYCHIGHARVMVVFDIAARYLRYSGYELTYVRNVTDIDDKIIQRANENKEEIGALTDRFIDAMHEDERALAVLPPDMEPRATKSMDDIILMITALFEKGLAYTGSNGDVFYAVNKFANYGALSGKKLDELQAGERVEVDQAKKNPFDFVLWKKAKVDEPYWNSPWGRGRPGWHIECSAMATRCLGNHFDIHGGGMDLQFPHHENEIAQSEGASGEKFVNVWMHNGFVRINEEKMSKSLGNFFTVREVLKQYRPEVVRFFVMSSHYRSPLNYSDEQLDDAGAALTRLYTALRGVEIVVDYAQTDYSVRFKQAMDDDFNTPVAVAVLFDMARELNKEKNNDSGLAAQLAGELKELSNVLGILQDDPESFLQAGDAVQEGGLGEQEIEQFIEQRKQAKQNKDWALADKIRDDLKEQGIVLEDVATGTSWRRE
ncbi:cysteinyl-tRNA synthetase [Bathymodiolus platifrons methanotrophic gill symbiont]|uniref:cysteine--tRNA ligase n=1 Tax=Bathymodiolus platifrons methanotrophic gill symbiont TaxID=113268 RepID=UPI000B413328|nr:cysteine--tRNA ligase [Bathymodiolus platifrons methanotrophic gill symbiont]MCK5869685.1 cysteine--tRNA ligase [Methyloprofundus sp.]TXK95678.1 cysteine--tRNA ligase [Methylococcaceae bacterium CS5]TXL03946.1 cysteine--tRNA ligase [Methylococcaceae bacterium CS1]TXL04382.1 cysteine--tRNA ligase [Methylococcaceae bacterium CS3]TXL18935.1 cysteine--tRNA ligase [Methylococcaceae bacterium HT5]